MPRIASTRSLLARVDAALSDEQAATARSLALLVFEVDRPHELHSGLGGEVQREVLAQAARRLRVAAERCDAPAAGQLTVARTSSSALVVLSEGTRGAHEPAAAAAFIQEVLAESFTFDAHRVFLSYSCGIARVTPTHRRAVDVLADATAALQAAKARGDGSRVVFDEALRVELGRAFETDNALRNALNHGELSLYYQPIVFLDSARPWGLEALLRWRRPDGQVVNPDSFISIAERGGLIVQIDRWVIAAACRQLKAWQVRRDIEPEFTLSVNVSGAHFSKPDLLATIDRNLRAVGLYGRSLALEITESAIMENAPFTNDMLQQLRALGIRVSIDDFGTGYSSLANLRRFDVDTLKIDRSFVSRLVEDQESREIVRTIVSLGSSLGKRVIAEGIENGDQATALRALGCHLGQGFHYSLPMNDEATTRYLRAAKGDDLFTT